MPKRTTAKQGFPRDPATCFASRHLSATHFKVYNVIVACAWHWRHKREGDAATGPLIFNASIVPWLCNAVPLSESYARTMVSEIEQLGWLVLLKEGERRENGRQAPNTYRVVEHAEFVKTHPNTCPPNSYAPDQETAEQFGVSYGDKISSGPIPKNFWPKEDTTVGRALRKVLGEEPSVLTDDESKALREHFDSFTVTRVQEPAAATSTREAVNADGLRNSGAAACGIQLAPPAEFSSDRLRNSGENLVTALVTSSTHPHTQPKSVSVCGNENPIDDGRKEVAALLEEFVKQNNGKPGACTKNQRRDMEQLAKGREKFRAAARAWFADHPWDDETTDPFSRFIASFEGYAVTGKVKQQRDNDVQARRDREASNLERATEWTRRKSSVDWDGKLNSDYLASLPQDDRDYIAKVAAATKLEDLPPDNGRIYSFEQIEFNKRQREQAAALENW
jgi:hypothetical protein